MRSITPAFLHTHKWRALEQQWSLPHCTLVYAEDVVSVAQKEPPTVKTPSVFIDPKDHQELFQQDKIIYLQYKPINIEGQVTGSSNFFFLKSFLFYYIPVFIYYLHCVFSVVCPHSISCCGKYASAKDEFPFYVNLKDEKVSWICIYKQHYLSSSSKCVGERM